VGTVVADPRPTWYSLHPFTELHAALRVYPEPAVEVAEPLSTFPITIELGPGVIDATAVLAWLELEPPVDVTGLVVETPFIS
jgi:hypothetical protein